MELTPRERVADLYERHRQPRTFEEDLALYQVTGYVIEAEDAFVMGRTVKHDAPVEAILCPHVSFAPEVCDAWFIFAFAGDIRAMLEIVQLVDSLPLVGWARRNGRIRWYWCEEALRRVSGLSQTLNVSTVMGAMARGA